MSPSPPPAVAAHAEESKHGGDFMSDPTIMAMQVKASLQAQARSQTLEGSAGGTRLMGLAHVIGAKSPKSGFLRGMFSNKKKA